MAYDEQLAERVRAALGAVPNVSERKMFGGLAFLVDGKMAVGVLKDELVVRVGKERYERALARPAARPMDFTGRTMTGMVYVSGSGVARGPSLESWIEQGIAGARAAPASRARGARKKAPKKA